MFRPLLLLPLLILALLLPGAALAEAPAKDSNPTKGDALGFAVTTLDEEPVELSSLDLYGRKPVVLVFWATWCGPCLKEIPAIRTLAKEFGDKVQFIGVSVDTAKTPEELDRLVRGAMTKHGIDYTVAIDTDRSLSKRFKITAIPMIYGVDLKGNGHTKVGLTSEENLRSFVKSLQS